MKFAVDDTLGKLATWLRILGFDTVLLRSGPLSPRKPVSEEDRILLTRCSRAPEGALIIKADKPWEQLKEAIPALGLDLDGTAPFSRCLRCNTLLREITGEEAAGAVPEYVLVTHSAFKHCPDCGKIFWPGTHQSRMTEMLVRLKREIS